MVLSPDRVMESLMVIAEFMFLQEATRLVGERCQMVICSKWLPLSSFMSAKSPSMLPDHPFPEMGISDEAACD
jgi:hypothetical protein